MQQEANFFKDYIPSTELIITKEGRIYHLDLLPEDIGDTKKEYQQFQNILIELKLEDLKENL